MPTYNLKPAKTRYNEKGDFTICNALELAANTYAVGDVLDVLTIPAGVRLRDLVIFADDLGTVTLDVGVTSVDADMFMDGIDAGALAATRRFNLGDGITAAVCPWIAQVGQQTADYTISILIATATGNPSGTITIQATCYADDPGA